jgi:hypothetical protein
MGTIVASPFYISLISRSLVAEIKLGVRRFGARTDGGLFLSLPQEGQFIAWDRSYYEIALEVECLWMLLIVGETLGQGEAREGWFRECQGN